MKLRLFSYGLALAASAMFGSTLVASAQQAAPPAVQQQPGQSTPAPDEAKLKSFAVAFLEVDRIGKEYSPRLKEAKTPEEQTRIKEEAGAAMTKAVESQDGITVDEYNSILTQAQSDPELANRISGKIREAGQ
jgi:hypothetical protein